MDVQEHDTPQTEVDVTPEETSESPVAEVTDLAGLYKYSGMVDALRDAMKVLVRFPGGGTDRTTLRSFGAQYNQLRTALSEVLPEGVQEWTQEVDVETVTVSGLYMAAVMLARWSDLSYQAPSFIARERITQVVQQAQEAQVNAAFAPGGPGLAGLVPGTGLPGGMPGGGPSSSAEHPQTGQYL